MTDVIYNAGSTDPDYFDVIRPSKMPSYDGEYGSSGNTYFSIRQSTFGVKGFTQTPFGELRTIFEFDLFGLGKNAGQTMFHFRKAFAELGHWGVGQHWSNFIDFDVFPNSVEYWGPNGMALFPNIMVRYMPVMGPTHLYISIERPGATADQGIFEDRVELDSIHGRLPLPDLTAEYRKSLKAGYVELAGVLRYMEWEDINHDQFNLSGNAIGWGLNLSSKVKLARNLTGKFQAVYGEGIENYMNDGPIDIGIQKNPGDPVKPVIGVPLPVIGLVAFVDQQWSDKFSSSVGWSMSAIENSDGQTADAFRRGDYYLANLLWYPAPPVMAGIELTYATRENYDDGYKSDMFRVQFSFRYNFLKEFYK
jgi:hypothetical protein